MPLELSRAELERVLDEAKQTVAAYFESLPTRSITPTTSGTKSEQIFHEPVPESGLGPAAFHKLADVLNHSRHQNGAFFGYVLGSAEPVAVAADFIASALNQNVTAWRSSPAAVAIERTVVSWLAQAIGCPAFNGSLTGGGSSANLMALMMAREAARPANQKGASGGVVYASEEVHMSIPKAVAALGIGLDNLRLIPTDDCFRMKTAELENSIRRDHTAGKEIIAIVATAGTVNTGIIDPLSEIAKIAHQHDVWLHIDGAYGALAAIASPEKFLGMERADSISLDAHKWLYQPLDCGCLLFRSPGLARTAFSHTGEYAKSMSSDPLEGFAFFDESLELSRRFRALKIWLSLRYHGLSAFREAIGRNMKQALLLARLIDESGVLEIMAGVELSTVCFRYKDKAGCSEEDLNRMNAAILARVNARGRVYLSNASLRGKFALRACIVNHRTTEADLQAVIDEVLAAAGEVIP
jgi:aromatic-L-amino-acid/L-tryptophan decarboxylase